MTDTDLISSAQESQKLISSVLYWSTRKKYQNQRKIYIFLWPSTFYSLISYESSPASLEYLNKLNSTCLFSYCSVNSFSKSSAMPEPNNLLCGSHTEPVILEVTVWCLTEVICSCVLMMYVCFHFLRLRLVGGSCSL